MLWVKKSRFTPPGYIEQCAAGPSCPVRGGVGCKRCSSSVSCVGCRCAVACFSLCVFRRSSVLRLRLVFFNQECLLFGCCGPWARGNITTANWQYAGPTAGRSDSPAVNWSRGTVRQATLGSSKCCKYRARWGGLGFAAAPAPLAFVSVRFRLSSCLIRWTVECVVYSS